MMLHQIAETAQPGEVGLVDRPVLEPECRELSGLSSPTRWRMERQEPPAFPRRFRLAAGRVAWSLLEIHEWLRDRKADRVRLKPQR